jgi:hypothetical protein
MGEKGNDNDGREAISEKRGKETKIRKGMKEKKISNLHISWIVHYWQYSSKKIRGAMMRTLRSRHLCRPGYGIAP